MQVQDACHEMAYLLQRELHHIHVPKGNHGQNHAHTQQQELLVLVIARLADGQALRRVLL